MTMIKNAIYTIISILSLAALSACQDDYFDKINGVAGEGTGSVNLTVDFQPAAGADLKSRAIWPMPGGGMGDIYDMVIVIFDENNSYVDMIDITKGMYKEWDVEDRNKNDVSNGQIAGETTTKRREISLTLSAGKFYIYAVANLCELADDNVTIKTSTYNFIKSQITVDENGVETLSRDTFRKIRRAWDGSNYRHNSEMSGIFTIGQQAGTTAFTGADENPVTVYPGVELHCWLRRLASKVTVDFDASGLNPSTTVYIREIRVRDIPYDCSLVEKNTVSEDAAADSPKGLYSNSKSVHGIVLCKDADYTDDTKQTINHYKNWPALTAGCPTLEDFAASTKDNALKSILEGVNHSNNAKSLFFYENMQGDGESKRQDAEGGGYEIDKDGNRIPIPDGIIDSPDSTNPDDPHYKDAKKAGTYVEVIGYYESYDKGNEGSGNIIYRFMLGKDAERNYDAERNHHYKLTLCLRGYANDYDWHIEYDRAQPPVTIPDEYYVSYGYNSETEFPISISGEIVDNIVTVEIVRNDWFPSNTWKDTRPSPMGVVEGGIFVDPSTVTKPDAANDPNNLSLGFLSLRKTHASAAGTGKNLAYIHTLWTGGGSSPDYVRNEYLNADIYNNAAFVPEKYRGKRSLGFRTFKFEGISGNYSGEKIYSTNGDADDADGSYRMWTKAGTANVPRQTTIYIPLFTRNRNLVKTTGYTGNNPYNVFQRRAAIRVRFKVRNQHGEVTDIDKTIPIIQATKLANPMGIWREWNNAAPFDVHLKYLNGREAESYTALTSHAGGWSAEVEQGADWILLNGGKRKIYGGENSEIRFTYRPAGILSGPNQTRCGIITVRYHNYSCIHKILVRQGYAPIQINSGGPYWHSRNLVTSTTESLKPTGEGSLFKYGNLDEPIDARNNVNDEPSWLVIKPNMWKDHSGDDFEIAGKDYTKKWGNISSVNPSGSATVFWPSITLDGASARMPYVREVVAMRDDEATAYHYGVLYGDNATGTGNNINEAYRYKDADPSTHSYGMRGCFIYNLGNANQVFFPIGSSGYGRRKEGRERYITAGSVDISYGWSKQKMEIGRGILRYSNDRISYMPQATAEGLPLLYDIFKSFGAVYWCQDYVAEDPLSTDNDGQKIKRSSIDMNYNTFDVFTLGDEPFQGTAVSGYGSDASFIRLVQDNPPQ